MVKVYEGAPRRKGWYVTVRHPDYDGPQRPLCLRETTTDDPAAQGYYSRDAAGLLSLATAILEDVFGLVPADIVAVGRFARYKINGLPAESWQISEAEVRAFVESMERILPSDDPPWAEGDEG